MQQAGQILLLLLALLASCSQSSTDTNWNYIEQINQYQQQFEQFQYLDVKKAHTYIDSINLLSKAHHYNKGKGMALLNSGLLESIKGNYNLALSYNKKAITIFENIKDDTLLAKSLSAMGMNYWNIGVHDKALQFNFDALKLNQTMGLKNEIASNFNRISMIYQTKGNVVIAEDYAKQALQTINKMPPNRSHVTIFHNLANIYGMQGKYDKAMQLDSIGLSHCEQLNMEFNKSTFYDNIANCYFFLHDLDASIAYHQKAIEIDSTFNNKKLLGDSYCNLGGVYEKKQDFKKAEAYYFKSLEMCRVADYKMGVKNALEALSTLAFQQGNAKDAYAYLQQSLNVKDSLINETSEKRIAEMQTLFETENKKQQIIKQKLAISRRNISLIILGSIFIMSLISYYQWYVRYKLKQERKLQQELIKEEERRTKAILESEENERQRLARELHDGVGQLLSVTKLNLSSIATAEHNEKLNDSINILDDSIKEIRNISHNMVPDVLQRLGLQQAIEDFSIKIEQAKKVEVHNEINGFNESSLNNTEKLMLFRIIQEAVNNALKYGKANNILIQLSADNHEITLLIEDDGIGFNIEEIKQNGGIGLKNMQLRTEILKGKFEIDSSPHHGTTIIIEIPLS